MINIDENTITQAVIEQLGGCEQLRLKQVLSCLVRHLHDFAREVRLTQQEWQTGIEFLTATGQKCDDQRQEFILLSDTLGLSMLMVALNTAGQSEVTESTVLGPFHVAGAPGFDLGEDVSSGASGIPLFVRTLVLGADGAVVAGATVDVWQADSDGLYDIQRPELKQHQGRGILRTNERGELHFRTVMPVAYPIPTDGPVGQLLTATGRHPWRPAHIHFMVQADGYAPLITHAFRGDDPYLDSNAVFGVRSSLIGDFVRHDPGSAPDGTLLKKPFYTLDFNLVLGRAGE